MIHLRSLHGVVELDTAPCAMPKGGAGTLYMLAKCDTVHIWRGWLAGPGRAVGASPDGPKACVGLGGSRPIPNASLRTAVPGSAQAWLVWLSVKGGAGGTPCTLRGWLCSRHSVTFQAANPHTVTLRYQRSWLKLSPSRVIRGQGWPRAWWAVR